MTLPAYQGYPVFNLCMLLFLSIPSSLLTVDQTLHPKDIPLSRFTHQCHFPRPPQYHQKFQ